MLTAAVTIPSLSEFRKTHLGLWFAKGGSDIHISLHDKDARVAMQIPPPSIPYEVVDKLSH
eukprot:6478417-Amphidinium_carterae.1